MCTVSSYRVLTQGEIVLRTIEVEWTSRCTEFATRLANRFPASKLEVFKQGRLLSSQEFSQLSVAVGYTLPESVLDYYRSNKCGFTIELVFDFYEENIPPQSSWPTGLATFMGFTIVDPLQSDDLGFDAMLHRRWGLDQTDPETDAYIKSFYCFATSDYTNFVGFDLNEQSPDPPIYYFDLFGYTKKLYRVANTFTSFLNEWEASGYPSLTSGSDLHHRYTNTLGYLDHRCQAVSKICSFLNSNWFVQEGPLSDD